MLETFLILMKSNAITKKGVNSSSSTVVQPSYITKSEYHWRKNEEKRPSLLLQSEALLEGEAEQRGVK